MLPKQPALFLFFLGCLIANLDTVHQRQYENFMGAIAFAGILLAELHSQFGQRSSRYVDSTLSIHMHICGHSTVSICSLVIIPRS